MWNGYMQLAGNEIVNSARAVAYARAAGLAVQCEPCDTLPEALGEDPYWSVEEGTAPWYDPAVPASRGVYGVMGMDVAGFNASTITRSPTALIGDGSALGPARRNHREIVWTVALITAGEAELSYAMEWLSAALLGSQCQGTCNGDELCAFSACPGSTPVRPGSAGLVGDAEIRHLYDVGVLAPPSVTETVRVGGGRFLWTTVTFTLAAAKPWIYHDPLATNVDWVSLGSGEIVSRIDPDQVYQQCLQPEPCATDPLCPPPALPPKPPAPVSPCYPSGLGDFRRSRIQVSPLDQATWLETVPVLEVQTGGSAMRRLLVRFWANPQNNPCGSFNDPCNACADINVSHVPEGSTLRVDGRVQRSVVECPQFPIGTATSTPTIYGAEGANFQWPTFPCPTGLCIEVWSRVDTTAEDATARVLLVPRADAG